MRALGLLDASIRAGDLSVGVAGGMESMSNAPYLLKDARFGMRMGDGRALDAMIHDGLTSPFSHKHMAHEADEVAAELELTRADLDRWALRSHQLAIEATDEGRMAEEIASITITSRKGDTIVEIDEAPRRDTSVEALAKLPALFVEGGTHTAGNSPGVNDGAAALVVASDEWARTNDRRPLATVIAQAQVADDFPYLARTPANAALKALQKIGLRPEQVDLWEINEAFASVALNSIRMLGINEDRVNVNGGAIALGHPIGASGRPDRWCPRPRAASPRGRYRLRRDLLRRWAGRCGRRRRRGCVRWTRQSIRPRRPPKRFRPARRLPSEASACAASRRC